jgi:tRNA(Arg) A34 adenosine deaminase TadA
MKTETPKNFIAIGKEYVNQHLTRVEQEHPYSPEYYFTLLLAKGIETREKGNYGIAAAYVIRRGGMEIIFFGQNNMVSANNPHGHAEMNSVQNARETFTKPIFDNLSIIVGWEPRTDEEISAVLSRKQEYGMVIVRQAPENSKDEEFIITTLEPCPQCTVGSVKNVAAENVIIGAADPFAGQVLENRLDHLSPLWSDPKITVTPSILLMQSENPKETSTYVPQELLDLLNDLFFQTKAPLDKILSMNKTGFLVIPRNLEQLAN